MTDATDLLLEGFHDANLAHAIALTEAGALPPAKAHILVGGLLDLRGTTVKPGLNGLYRSLDEMLQQRIGDNAKWMQFERSHQETVCVAFLLTIRHRVLDLARKHLSFAETAIQVADQNRNVVISDRGLGATGTISTLGHGILTFIYPVFRDLERLQHCYRGFNSSPAGAGQFGAHRVALDRDRLRSLLGFDEIRLQSRDAVWQPDTPIELMAAIVALLVNLNRLTDDLRKWTLDVPVELPDTSWIRTTTSGLLAKVPVLAALGKDLDDPAEGSMLVAAELESAVDSAGRVISGVTSLLATTAEALTTALDNAPSPVLSKTDLTHLLSTRPGIDHSTAVEIVRAVERLAASQALPGTSVTPRLIDEVAIALVGRKIELSAEELSAAMDPGHVLSGQRSPEVSSPERLTEMMTECRARLVRESLWVSTAQQRLVKSKNQLLSRAREVAVS